MTNVNLCELPLRDLLERKNQIIVECHEQIGQLEQNFMAQLSQLCAVKQSVLNQYQQTLSQRLMEIDQVIGRKLPLPNHHHHQLTQPQQQPPSTLQLANMCTLPSLLADIVSNMPSLRAHGCGVHRPNSSNTNTNDSYTNPGSSSENEARAANMMMMGNIANIANHVTTTLDDDDDEDDDMDGDSDGDSEEEDEEGTESEGGHSCIDDDDDDDAYEEEEDTKKKKRPHKYDKYPHVSNVRFSDLKPTVNGGVAVTAGPQPAPSPCVPKNEADGERQQPISCRKCKKKFESNRELERHILDVHMHKCAQCPRAFLTATDLKKHQRIHNGIKVYECKICYKTYSTSGSLSNHMRVHNDSTLFRCSFCNKGFTQSHHRKRHERNLHGVGVTEVVIYNCKYCERTFKYKTSCRRHEKRAHEKNQNAAASTKSTSVTKMDSKE